MQGNSNILAECGYYCHARLNNKMLVSQLESNRKRDF